MAGTPAVRGAAVGSAAVIAGAVVTDAILLAPTGSSEARSPGRWRPPAPRSVGPGHTGVRFAGRCGRKRVLTGGRGARSESLPPGADAAVEGDGVVGRNLSGS